MWTPIRTSTVFFMLRGSRVSSKGYAPLSITNRMTVEDQRSAAGPLYFAASRLLVSTCAPQAAQVVGILRCTRSRVPLQQCMLGYLLVIHQPHRRMAEAFTSGAMYATVPTVDLGWEAYMFCTALQDHISIHAEHSLWPPLAW
jgi:hypothetical protein